MKQNKPTTDITIPIGSVEYTSGEMIITYWLERKVSGKYIFWKQDDWIGSKPTETSLEEVYEVGLQDKYLRAMGVM